MPKAIEEALKRAAAKKGYTGKRADHFVYGTMANMRKRGSIDEAAKRRAS